MDIYNASKSVVIRRTETLCHEGKMTVDDMTQQVFDAVFADNLLI